MEKLDIAKIKEYLLSFIDERDWGKFHSLKNLSMALNVESSELLEIFQWMSEKDSNHIAKDSKTYLQIKEELADIFFYLILIAHKAEIDLEEAFFHKLIKNELKYPVNLSKGKSIKYDKLKG